VPLAFDVESVDLGAECLVHLAGGAGEINGHPARASGVNHKPVGAKPLADPGNVFLGDAELFGVLVGGEPLVKPRGTDSLEIVGQLFSSPLALRRPPQLQLDPVERERIVNSTTIELRPNLGTGVTGQQNAIVLIDRLDDAWTLAKREALRRLRKGAGDLGPQVHGPGGRVSVRVGARCKLSVDAGQQT
jgi:hypothetical protein